MHNMTRHTSMAMLALSLSLVTVLGCSPALNWRQLSLDAGRVQILLPCKPDQASRDVPLRIGVKDVAVPMHLQGCEASGMQFTFGQMTVPEGMPLSTAMTAWRLASLAPLQLGGDKDQLGTWQLQGAQVDPAPTRTRVRTDRHQVEIAWFAYGQTIYQAAVYGASQDKTLPEAAETYFSGIKLP